MTHVFFDPESVDWSSFFTSQHGRGQKQYFVGSKYQRGFGFLGNVARFLTPIAKNIASSAGQEGLAAGQRVLSDIAQGRDLRDAVREHSKQDNQFCDLNKTFLYLSTSIERKDKSNWIPITKDSEADQHVGVIQNFGHSFVKTLKVSISGVESYDSEDVKKGLCEASCYYVDDVDQDSYTNTGFKNRASRFADGAKCETMLQTTPAKYPLRKIEIRSLFIPRGTSDLSHNVFTSIVPRRLIVGFVSTGAYTGNPKESPFVFEHAKIRSISVEANGNIFPGSPYSLNFGRNKYIRAFVDMYTGLGMDDGERTMSINTQKFVNGWCFFVIPMTSTLEDTPGFELIRNGTTSIKVQFNEPIKDGGYEMIVLGEFDSILSINANRVLSSDGSI
ncbi:hypothetical protein niasHT_029009 [Heterodera trifolii]|uniref:Uncharacterized protein n=1 Tax=Heterodera trifolii TaxID=157864 RepID=A0ABD2KSE4_9BILA